MISEKHGRVTYDGLNRLIFKCLILFTLTIVFIFSGAVRAEEKRHHDAHVHGIANMNIAVEGNNIYIEFSSPSANIVGFEHYPRTREQKNAVADAVKKLQKGDSLFLLSAKSESTLVNSSADTDIDKDADHHSESEHAHSKEEHHDKADEHERHSEFEAQYQFACLKPDELSQIEVMLFQAFPGIEHIKVQLLTESKQTAVELTAKQNKISL